MQGIQKFIFSVFCFLFLTGVSLAAQDDLSKNLEFYDMHTPAKTTIAPYVGKPWNAEEKKLILGYFSRIKNDAPGLLERLVAYRPIQLFRTIQISNVSEVSAAAIAITQNQAVFFPDIFFSLGADDQYETLAHELTHLADAFLRLVWSKEWIDLVEPRMKQVRAELEKIKPGLTVYEAVREGQTNPTAKERYKEIAVKAGFPQLWGASGLHEALAVYTSNIITVKGYSPPQEIKAFIQKKLLSMPFKPEPMIQYLHQGLIALDKEQWDEAIKVFDAAIKLDPKFSGLYLFRAQAFVGKNDAASTANAIADCTQGIKLSYELRDEYYKRGLLYVKTGQIDKAMADFSQSIKDMPWSTNGYIWRSMGWMEKKEYDKAIEDLNTALKIDPNYSGIYSMRADAWMAKEDYDRAIADYSEFIKRVPNASARVYYSRGRLLFAKNELDNAIADFNEALNRKSDYEEAYFLRGYALAKKGETDKAIADFNEVIRRRPDYAVFYYMRGLAWQDKKDYQKAIVDFTKAIELNPKYFDAYNARATSYWRIGNLDKCIPDYNSMIKLDSNSFIAYGMRGDIWNAKGDYNKAIADYTKALEINPKLLDVYNNRAVVYYKMRDYDKAWKDVHKAEGMGWKFNPAFITELRKASGREK